MSYVGFILIDIFFLNYFYYYRASRAYLGLERILFSPHTHDAGDVS